MKKVTINDVLKRTHPKDVLRELPTPRYDGLPTDSRTRIGLAVEDMKRHTTDEGWQIFAGLESVGYELHGHRLGPSITDVPTILRRTSPSVVVVQDKREWDIVKPRDFRDRRGRFINPLELQHCHDVFRLTILKDAQGNPPYHDESAREIQTHGWIVYYHPQIVKHLATYVRERHLIRTYHTLDSSVCPRIEYGSRRDAIVSGAVSGAYPLRRRLYGQRSVLPDWHFVPHPGYHRRGCQTRKYLETLSQFKVSICTASKYGYALRKIIESTAVGCRVVTDLPVEDRLPLIDDNLIRIPSDISTEDLRGVVAEAVSTYSPDRQEEFRQGALSRYDYRVEGQILAEKIEHMRANYGGLR